MTRVSRLFANNKTARAQGIPNIGCYITVWGVSDDVEITFDLEKFPSLLQNILYKFMEMHTKHKQIEKERELFDKPI